MEEVIDQIGMEYETFDELKKIFFLEEKISIFEIKHIRIRNEPYRLKVRRELLF
jgi:hypothetical protein